MKVLLLLTFAILTFQYKAEAQTTEALVSSAAGAAYAAKVHASTAVSYASRSNLPVVGPSYAYYANQSATSAVIASQTALQLSSAALQRSNINMSQINSVQSSVNSAINSNSIGTSILSGGGSCGASLCPKVSLD